MIMTVVFRALLPTGNKKAGCGRWGGERRRGQFSPWESRAAAVTAASMPRRLDLYRLSHVSFRRAGSVVRESSAEGWPGGFGWGTAVAGAQHPGQECPKPASAP